MLFAKSRIADIEILIETQNLRIRKYALAEWPQEYWFQTSCAASVHFSGQRISFALWFFFVSKFITIL